MDARVEVGTLFDAFSVPAIVTRPQEASIETAAVFLPDESGTNRSLAQEDYGVEITRAVTRRIVALKVNVVPSAPVGTLIEAAEVLGGESKRWLVDEINRVEADLIRVFVRPMESAEYLESWGKA
jgi:hypothetical protein